MVSVTFSTFCHPPHLEKLHAAGQLEDMIASHKYDFDEVIVIHQRCRGLEYRPLAPWIRVIESEDYPNILERFGLYDDPVSRKDCHGENAKHWWMNHVTNHLTTLVEAQSDYIVFSDADCDIIGITPDSWITKGIEILEKYPDVLIVGPGDGSDIHEAKIPEARLTKNVSQQLFLANREKLLNMEWDIPWNWEYLAPGQPMAEFYHMGEGRIFRHLYKHNMWRAILSDEYRYWHYQW